MQLPQHTPQTSEVSHDSQDSSIVQTFESPLPDAVRLWRHVFGDRPDLIQLFSGFWKSKGPKRDGKGNLADNTAEEWFTLDQLEQAAAWAAQQDRCGREVYFCTHQLTVRQRKKPYAASVVCLWADGDGADLDTCPIRPTAVVETSPGHTAPFWRLSYPIAPDAAEKLNKRLAKAIGADGSGFDLTQLLRVPGTHNRKREEWADVKLRYIDEDRTIDPAELDRILPQLPSEPQNAMPYRFEPSAALSDDDAELIAMLGKQSPVSGRLFAGNTSDYEHNGVLDSNEADWGLAQDLLRATGGDQERTYRLMRQSCLERPKWDERRPGGDYLTYTIGRAANAPSTRLTSTRWHLDGGDVDAASPGDCPNCQRERERTRRAQEFAQSLLHQVQLIPQVLQLNLAPEYKTLILWMMVLVGVKKGQEFDISAKGIAEKIHLSDQFVRNFLHAGCRYDVTDPKHKVSPEVDPKSALHHERGLFDLGSTRARDTYKDANPYARMFKLTPLTGPGYTEFLEAAIERAPELFPAPVKRTRQKHDEVTPPLPVAIIPTCHEGHLMHSDTVTCAECGEDFNRETRYTPLVKQNDMPERSVFHSPRTPVATYSDTGHRFEPATPEIERLLRLYDKAAAS